MVISEKKYWLIAKKIIPSGNSFLSKNPTRHPSSKWPKYFLKAKGCKIWDLRNKVFIDFSFMGVGTNVLGYSNSRVNSEVLKIVKKSNMSTMNSLEEVLLAKELINLHKWSEQAKFAKTGAEANTLAVRIARAYTGKEKVIVCGYHGWHDWYLSANLKKNNSLDTHLFKDLKISGVPKFLKNETLSFKFNDYDSLNLIVKKNKKKIACLIMEVERTEKPKDNFLLKVRNLCNRNNIILIFDECTTGFREHLGGRHKMYKINPDIAMFGKALGNGYPITAIIGKKKIFSKFKNTFASSTFWSDRIGFAAALATIKEMKRIKSWKKLKDNSIYIKSQLKRIATSNNLEIHFSSIDCLLFFQIKGFTDDFINKFIAEKMIKKGYLAGNKIYVSISHTKKYVNNYINEMSKIFRNLNLKLKKINEHKD